MCDGDNKPRSALSSAEELCNFQLPTDTKFLKQSKSFIERQK